jgi:hypothetical protein
MTKPHPQFEALGFTQKQIQAARRYAIRPNIAGIRKAKTDPKFFAAHVTPTRVRDYIEKQYQSSRDILAGDADHNFTVWQRMNYKLTGECPGLLA